MTDDDLDCNNLLNRPSKKPTLQVPSLSNSDDKENQNSIICYTHPVSIRLQKCIDVINNKDDSDFGTDGSLTDVAPQTDDEVAFLEESIHENSDGESELGEDSSEAVDTSSEESDDLDDMVQNPFMYPPSQPIPYDTVRETEQDQDMEFFRAVTALKVRHIISDAAIDDFIKVTLKKLYFDLP